MRVKLDENLPLQLSRLFTESGHDAVTVLDEGIGGATDAEIASVCLAEERVLVTQDVDFADIRMYPPGDYPGNEDGVYVAEAPELPGCAAHGDTQEAALESIGQAVDLWLETAREFGDPIPEPKGERLMLT